MSSDFGYPYFVIGLDIGGTKIAGGILRYVSKDKQPEFVYLDKIASEAKKGPDVLIKNITNFALSLKAKANEIDSSIKVLSIGMGCAGHIDKNTGKVMATTDSFPGFAGCGLCKIVSDACNLPVFALNDVQSHTFGEARWGVGRDAKNFVLLAVGTGVGGAVVVDGKLLLGSHGFAGELGHVQANLAAGIDCTCGHTGHLEAVASGSGIEKTYSSRTGIFLSGPEISELANKGNDDAIYAIELAGRCLGQIIAMYLNIFDPEFIVLSGSVLKAGKIWRDAIELGYEEEVIGEIKDNLKLIDAKLGDDAAIIGACEYALYRLGENK